MPEQDANRQQKWALIQHFGSEVFVCYLINHKIFYTTKHNEQSLLNKYKPVFLKQIHSDIIIDIDNSKTRIGDGLITQKNESALGIKIADCLPVTLINKEKTCIIHCGWRSIIKGIAKKAARLMRNYQYIFGACICSRCYEVGYDTAKVFLDQYKNAVITREKKYFIDLKTAVVEDLGKEKLISDLDLCTKCHPEYFYSFRGGDEKKRNYAFVKRSKY